MISLPCFRPRVPRVSNPSAPSRPADHGSFWIAAVTVVLGLLFSIPAMAQVTMQRLSNHVRPEVTTRRAALVGSLPNDQSLNVSIVLPLRNQADLTALLARLYDPASPDYHKFLSVADFTSRFGPTSDDYQQVVAFAQSNGLTVTRTYPNRLVVSVQGTAAQVNAAFNVQMNTYQHPTENRTFYSPDREPSLALGVKVAHISGLNNFSLPHPNLAVSQNAQVSANVTGSGPGGSYLASDMRAAYYGGNTLDGNGQTVGIFEFDGYLQSDVDLTFSSAGQSNRVPIKNVLLDGMTGGLTWYSNDIEQVLDIVQAIGMAPGLDQVRVYIGSLDADILNSMASENIAKELSSSWSWLPEDPATADVFFQEFAAQGQSFFAASGDDGAYDLAISPFFYPQEDTYVTAVGGTHLETNGAGGSWASESAWNSPPYGSGGGISPDSIALPTWQSGVATAANGGSTTLRNIPDVAMEGDFDNYFCYSGRCGLSEAGTSFAAPRWAGFMALINQQAVEAGNAPQGGLGFINPALYSIYTGQNYGNDFHDVTVGDNNTNQQPTWFNAGTGYDLVTGLGSANGQSLIDDLAGPQVPGFWILSSASSVLVNQGGTASTTIKITDAAGFSGNVSLAITSTLPSGLTATWGTNPTSGSSVLTFTATSSAAPATATVTVTGTSGSLTASTSFTVAIHAPDFAVTAAPVSIKQGATGTATITVTPMYGFSGNVNLAVTGLPSGVTASWGTNPTSTTSVLTFTVSGTAAIGNYPLTITGTSGSLTESTTLLLSVTGPSFQLASSGQATLGLGSSTTNYISVLPQNGFTGNVSLAVSGLPSGVTASFSPNPVPSNNYSTLTLTASSSAQVGTSTLTITGTSGSLTATTTLTLTVATPSFTISNPGPINIGQGNSNNSWVYIYPQNGFNKNVTFSIAGLPSGVTTLWSPNPTSNSSMLTLAVASTVPAGQYQFTIQGTSGSLTATASVTLGVHAPTFTLTSGYNVDIGQGLTANTYVNINSQYGFTGKVTLAASGLPSGVTASFSTNPATGYSSVNFTATSSAPAGQYTVTITGTSGTQTASTTVPLVVHAPAFSVYAPSSLDLGQGTSTSTYVSISQLYGFSGAVNLAVTGLPAGITASFSTNPTTSSSSLILSVGATVREGSYSATITGTSGSQTATAVVQLNVHIPTFTLSGPTAIDIGQGTSTSTSVYAWAQYGFTGGVTYSISGLPSGVTGVFSTNPSTRGTTLILSADASAPVGQSTVTVTGTSGSQTLSFTFTLGVHVPTFTIGYLNSATIGQGGSITEYVYTYTQYGFTGGVTYTVSGLPTGVTASFSPNPTTWQSVLTLNADSSAPLGQSTVTVTGTSGSQTVTTTFTLTVGAQSFSLYDSPNTISLNEGGSNTSTIYIAESNQFDGNVTFSASGLPDGVTANFAPNPSSSSTILTLSASNAAVPGNANVTITGTSGNLTASTSLALVINSPQFALSVAPAAVQILPGTSQNTKIQLTPQNGFNGTVGFTATGLPSGVTAEFTPAAGGSTVLKLTASSTAAAATSTVTVTGTSGQIVNSVPLAVTVRTTPQATTTTLAVTAGGNPVTSVPAGTPLTLTATVNAGSAPITMGQVNFCDATANDCNGMHLLGTAQLTSVGIASLNFIPGAGSHSYKAVFAGTLSNSASTSDDANATITSSIPTTTTLTTSGTAGNYSLTASVTGLGATSPTGNVSILDVTNGGVVIGSGAVAHSGTSFSLSSAASQTVGNNPLSTASADFNGDAIPDAAVVNASDGTVSILLGKGDGTFTAGTTLAVGPNPTWVGTGDFNRDGVADLAILNASSNSVIIMLGKGDGTFTPSSFSPPTGLYPQSAAIADFNGDGIQDIVVANSSSNSLTVLLGAGDGTFSPSPLSAQTGNYPGHLAVGDFNQDGTLDVAVSYQGSQIISILIGNGDGSFATPQSITLGATSGPIVAGDFNGDGILDLAFAPTYGQTIAIYTGNGDGTFTPQAPLTVSYNTTDIKTGDFNADGILDLVVGTQYGTISWFLGKGDGTFAMVPNAPNQIQAAALAVADFNGDGIADVLAANSSTNNVTAVLSQLAQTSSVTVPGLSPLGQGTHNVAAKYTGDSSFAGSTSPTKPLTAQAGSPLVTVKPAAANITADQSLSVTVTVDGGSANPAPTGSITLASGTYTSQSATLSNGSATIVIPAGSLSVGTDPLTAAYTPDAAAALYKSAQGTGSVTVTAPRNSATLTVTPSASTITNQQDLNVTLVVSGAAGQPTPTGTVTLSSGSSTWSQTLTNGSATFTIPKGSLSSGTDTLTAVYSGDAIYASATGSAKVTVTAPLNAATLTVTPSASTITDQQDLNVTLVVSGPAGQPTPTGTVTISSGSSNWSQTLTSGSATITIPKGSLSSGTDTLTAVYSGDATYTSATGTASVTVAPLVIVVPTPPAPVSAGSTSTVTVNFDSGSTYSGTLNLACTLVSSPAGAQSLPTCSLNPTTLTLSAAGNAPVTLTVKTTAASTASMVKPFRWGLESGSALALVALFGISSRRRRWLSALVVLLMITAGAIGCGGGGSSSSSGGGTGTTGTPVAATTSGKYTFTVTGTDTTNPKLVVTTTVPFTVQ